MVGQLRRPLTGKRGGNISYLCRQNFIDLLFSGFVQTSFRFEIKKEKKIQSIFEPGSFWLSFSSPELLAHAVGSRFESCQWIIFLATSLILSPQIMTVHCTVVPCALCSMTVMQCALCSTVQYKNRVENGGPSKLFEFTFLPSWYRLNMPVFP